MDRQTQFKQREENILTMALQLLLESGEGDITLDLLAENLDLAKGTLYKHFQSKDELFLRLVIDHEKQLYHVCSIDDGASASIARLTLHHLLNPQKTTLLHHLEERLAASSVGLRRLFAELYDIRRERMKRMIAVTTTYLEENASQLTTRDYMASIWSVSQGGAAMLNSSFYQRYLGRRDTLRLSLVQQVLDVPKLYPKQLQSKEMQSEKPHSTIA